MDISLPDNERSIRTAFHKKKEELINEKRMFMDCPKCLMIFFDMIMYRMHMAMHIPLPSTDKMSLESSDTWKCSLCKREFSDRREFYIHTVKYSHSLIPRGFFVPPALPYHFGLPDLASLCQPSDLLKELAELVKANATDK